MMNKKGFTLLEVIIAVTIMTVLVALTARMVNSGIDYKKKIQKTIDRFSGSRDVLNLMSRDIAMAFNYRDVNVEIYNEAQKARQKKPPKKTNPNDDKKDTNPPADETVVDPNDPNDPNNEKYATKEVLVYSRFVGEIDKLNFTSLNNFRGAKDLKQSNQAEVGYFLKNCQNRKNRESSSNCLWRRTSAYMDKEVKEGGKENPVLENVKSLKFRYLMPGDATEVWLDTWSSIEADSEFKDQFPLAVEITLVTENTADKDKELALTVVAPILFPNNPKKDTTNAPATTN
jgi:prepilin-type N-terminal cleavage/methylation domain-containing protein